MSGFTVRRSRRQIFGNEADSWAFCTEANGNLIPEAHRLANEAIERHLVLFIGAGVSAGAGLPTWKELLDDFAEDAGFDGATRNALAARDPRDQATLIERELEHEAQPLKSRVAARLEKFDRFSLLHGLLASLPSQEAVTTNYDMLFETAYESRERRVAVLSQNPRGTDGHWLLKLHGSVDTPDKMILTRSDYLSMPRQYGALMGLVQGLLLMRRMVFVGYSLSDEDFHELIDEVRAARGGTDDGVGKGIALTLSEDPLSRKLWEQDLDIVPMVTGPDVDLNIAGRELELFLNLVGFLSTTSAGFFLDDSYSDLSEDERELREQLQLLAEATAGSDLDTVGHLVEEFLKGLGAADDG